MGLKEFFDIWVTFGLPYLLSAKALNAPIDINLIFMRIYVFSLS